MPNIYLVRHGRAAGDWGVEQDPGLDDLGREQARAAARVLAPLGPMQIITSPMARTRETSMPLAQIWHAEPRVEERVSEIPFPCENPAGRVRWLQTVMTDQWPNLGPDLQAWREQVIEALCSLDTDSAVFSHFIAINAAVGHATGDDRVVSFRPDNGSITIVQTNGNRLNLVERGAQSITEVR